MAAGVKFTGGGKLLTKLKKIAKNSKKTRITAGFYKDAKYEDGTPVAQVAAANNFGTLDSGGFIPPRPFFNDAINENKDKWAEDYSKALKKTDYDIERSAKLVGEEMRADIQEKINTNNYPMNKWSTIRASGYLEEHYEGRGKKRHMTYVSTEKEPLKDTYHMMRSVAYQYNDEKEQYAEN